MKSNNETGANIPEVKLFLVDDDALFLKSLEIAFLQIQGYTIKTFTTGELCLESLSQNPDVIILDYHLDGFIKSAMNGIETLDQIKASKPEIAVILLSSQDKIDVAIRCMHHGAFDYVVKSETAFLRLQKVIESIFILRKVQTELKWYMDRM